MPKIGGFPLTLIVALTTVLHTNVDMCMHKLLYSVFISVDAV